jgi:uncharacterized membrane protein
MHQLLHRLTAEFKSPNNSSAELWAHSKLHQMHSVFPRRAERSLLSIAALFLGLGLIFWVAANWQDQSRQFKFYLIQSALLVCVLCAAFIPRGRKAFLLTGTLCLGALLAFVGQTYQTGADPWQLFAAWAALTLIWMVIARSDGLWSLWVVIVGMGIALWSGDQLFDPSGVFARWRPKSLLTPSMWACLLFGFAGLQFYTPWKFPYALRIAAFLSLSAWCTYAFSGLFKGNWLVFFTNLFFVFGAALVAWLGKPRDFSLLAFAALAINVLFLGWFAYLLEKMSSFNLGSILVFGLVAAATVGFTGHWIYRQQQAISKADHG